MFRVCAEPGCPLRVLRGDTYCDVHIPKPKRSPDKRPSASKRGYGATWRKKRAHYLHKNPDCVLCGDAATDVDHIDGLGPSGPRGYDDENLRSLCHSCHSKRTAADQPGGWNRGSES